MLRQHAARQWLTPFVQPGDEVPASQGPHLAPGGIGSRRVGSPTGVTTADGDLAATTTKTGGVILQLSHLQGDITLQLPVDTSVAPTVLDSDE